MDPAVRASDDDRQRVVGALERHATAGRLQLNEFDERVIAALGAVTLGDLAALMRDLPQDSPTGTTASRATAGGGVQTGLRSLLVAFALASLVLIVLGALLAVGR